MAEVSADWRPPKAILKFLEKVAEAFGPYCEFIGCHVVQENRGRFEIEVLRLPNPELADVQVSWLMGHFSDEEGVWICANATPSRKGKEGDRFPFLEIAGKVEGFNVELWVMLTKNECCAPPMVLDCKTKEWTFRANHGCFHGNREERAPEADKEIRK